MSEAAGQQAGGACCVMHGPGGKPNSIFSIGQDSYRKCKSGNLKMPTLLAPNILEEGKIIKQTYTYDTWNHTVNDFYSGNQLKRLHVLADCSGWKGWWCILFSIISSVQYF